MSIDLHKLAHQGVQSLIPYKPGKSSEELAKEKGLTDIIKMASNENPLGCSSLVIETLRNASNHLIATYPSAINHPIMAKLAHKSGINPSQLILSNGSDYLFCSLLTCFALGTGKHILTHDYAFSTYAIQAQSLNIPVKTVAIENNWQVNIDALIEACSAETALIFIANPNNPTGVLLSYKEIKRLLKNIPECTLLVLDEAYFEYAASSIDENPIDWLAQFPNLVITRTFSKVYGLAGLRLGYGMAHSVIIDILRRVQLPFNVNQLALNCGMAALNDTAFIELSIRTNNNGMKQLCAGLDALNLTHIPSSCNFITFDCKEDGLNLYNYLLEHGIIVRPLHAYKMDQFLRVSIGTEEQNVRFLHALNSYYQTR